VSKAIHEVLMRPILTEKSVTQTQLARFTRHDAEAKAGAKNASAVRALTEQKLHKYTFIVALGASKPEIAEAVEALYASEKVKVATVNTMHVRGKHRRSYAKRGRAPGKGGTSPAWKKAVVTLTPDSPNIPMLEGA
jgi:large subunit ribosomal protein L23